MNMKKGILFLLLVSTLFAKAQSLKDALFSGKLKNQPGTVIRKGDDLSTKMDTARKATNDDAEKTKTVVLNADSSAKQPLAQSETSTITPTDKKDNSTVSANLPAPNAASAVPNTSKESAPAMPGVAKNNNVLWKEYIDSVTANLKSDVLSSKKIKRGTYYATVSYVIGTDGQVTVNDVSLSPDNAFLQQQLKDRLALDVPHLNPVLSDSGTPRKVTKRYNFTITKD
jgi:hypothetical protein